MKENIKDKIFSGICQNDLCIMNFGYPLPAKAFCEPLNISYYRARKYCKELQEEGLIEFIRDYIPDQFSYEGELECEGFFIEGWRITKKAEETQIYKDEYAREEKIRKECFGD